MIKALLKDQAFLDDVKDAPSKPDTLHMWWLGQSGYLVKWKKVHLLIDPYLSDSLTKKYANTDKPHVRMGERVIAPERLDFIDAATSSHNHTDHLDGETLVPLLQKNPGMRLLIPEANRDFVANRLQCLPDFPIGLNEKEKVELLPEVSVHGIPAAHNELERDDQGRCKYMGYVFQLGPFQVYHSGDTLWRQEIVDALEPFSPDVAILPINGNVPERRVAGNLNAEEALRLGRTIGAKVLIPCHYHMFTFNTVDPDGFIAQAREASQAVALLQFGERFTFSTDPHRSQ